MTSLQPLVYHFQYVLLRHIRDGPSQVLLVRSRVADELSLVFVFALGLGLDEHCQGEGVAMEFDEVRAGHGVELSSVSQMSHSSPKTRKPPVLRSLGVLMESRNRLVISE